MTIKQRSDRSTNKQARRRSKAGMLFVDQTAATATRKTRGRPTQRGRRSPTPGEPSTQPARQTNRPRRCVRACVRACVRCASPARDAIAVPRGVEDPQALMALVVPRRRAKDMAPLRAGLHRHDGGGCTDSSRAAPASSSPPAARRSTYSAPKTLRILSGISGN